MCTLPMMAEQQQPWRPAQLGWCSRKSNTKNTARCFERRSEKLKKSTRATWCSIANYSPTQALHMVNFSTKHISFLCFPPSERGWTLSRPMRDVMTDQRDWKDVKYLSRAALTYLEGRQSCYVRCSAKPRCVCTTRRASQAISMVCTTPSQIGGTLCRAFVLACEEDRFRIYHHSDFHFRRTQRDCWLATMLSMAAALREFVRWHSRVDCGWDERQRCEAMSTGATMTCDVVADAVNTTDRERWYWDIKEKTSHIRWFIWTNDFFTLHELMICLIVPE